MQFRRKLGGLAKVSCQPPICSPSHRERKTSKAQHCVTTITPPSSSTLTLHSQSHSLAQFTSRLVCSYNYLPDSVALSSHSRLRNNQEQRAPRNPHRVQVTSRSVPIPRARPIAISKLHVDPSYICQLPAQRNGEAHDVCDWDCPRHQLTWVFVRASV
jgi:hypothetical protein